MTSADHILISLEPRHATSILDGVKRVELRRRTMHVSPGVTVWLYAKQPVGSIVGLARVQKTHAASPAYLWRKFGPSTGISKEEFCAYFEGVLKGVALVLTDAVRLRKQVSLDALREPVGGFYPPQFFARLAPDHPVLRTVLDAV